MIVVDASAIIELLRRTETGARVQHWVENPDQTLHAPHLIDVEVANALRRLAAREVISHRTAARALTLAAGLDLHRYPHTDWGTLATSTANLDALVNPASNSGLNVGNPANDLAVNGLAFDLSDFVGTGPLSGVAGIRIAGGGTFDPVVVSFVPEPSTALLLASGLAALAVGRRRMSR